MKGTWVSATGFRRFYRVRQYGAVSKAGYVTGSTDTGHEEDKWVSEWLKDNSILINTDCKIFYRLPLSGGQKPAIVLQTEFENNDPHVSPDGRWVAYQSVESGLPRFDRLNKRRQVSNSGGGEPHSPLTVQPFSNVWDVTGDGKKVLFGEAVGEGGQAITVVLNWTAGLKR
jgi:hypothetical protein